MKNILITGKNSYIGNQFEEWLSQWPDKYNVKKISLKTDNWQVEDWSHFDIVLHVAGIAHNSSNSKLEDVYYHINRDLTILVANKAKNDGVKQFIYMSSIIVFGTSKDKIDLNSNLEPDNFYGDSKLQAEQALEKLKSDQFKISIVRPPMVYGKDSKGNFPLLSKLANITPVFPNFDNKRSMIYIKNLTEFLRKVIETKTYGYLHPQNKELIKTTELVKLLGQYNNHQIYSTTLFNFLIRIIKKQRIINKLFGDLYYTTEMRDGDFEYQLFDLEKSISDIFDN
ncbi:NAD-dependent epimerase/dehydratase family protein [Aerococcus urinaeequi]